MVENGKVQTDEMDAFEEVELTEEENQLYDRQIRVWGVEAQKRLRTGKILIAGLNGLGAEVTKNIVLAGVRSVVLLDDKVVTTDDLQSHFLITPDAIGRNRAEASVARAKILNPTVQISADTDRLGAKDSDFFRQFHVVVIIGVSNSELMRIDAICREKKIKLLAADVWGMFGYCFSDLQDYEFMEDEVTYKKVPLSDDQGKEKQQTETVVTSVPRKLTFPSFSCLTELDFNAASYNKRVQRCGPGFIVMRILQEFRERFQRDPHEKTYESDFLELQKIRNDFTSESRCPNEQFFHIFGIISPAAAVVGGVLAQEVIKIVTKHEPPLQNLFLFDPEECCGFIETIGVN